MAAKNIVYSYDDVPTLKEFAASNARIRGILGPFRSGKSSASVMEIARRGCEQKPHEGVRRSRWLVVRNTYQELKDSTIRTVHMWLPPERFGTWHASDHNYTVKGLKGEGPHKTEIEIWFRALDRPEHLAKLLSVEVTGAWINEAKEVPWGIIEGIDGRIGQYPPKFMGGPSWVGMWMDTNPPDVDSKWYNFFEEQKHDPGRVQIFRQPSGRSPRAENLSNLPSNRYYHDLAYGKGAEYIKVFVDGQYGFVADSKPIYPEYVDKVHCQEVDPVPGLPIIRGWDFGLTPSCTFNQILPDGRWLTFDEMTSDNMGIVQFSDDVLVRSSRFRGEVEFEDWGDPAGEQRSGIDLTTAFEILIAKGIAIRGGPQTPSIRQESVRWLLRTPLPGAWEPRYVIHPRCKMLRKGFMGGYHRRRMQIGGGVERYSDQAQKNIYSHPHDALQYPIAAYFGRTLTRSGIDDDDLDWVSSRHGVDDSTRSEVTGY